MKSREIVASAWLHIYLITVLWFKVKALFGILHILNQNDEDRSATSNLLVIHLNS